VSSPPPRRDGIRELAIAGNLVLYDPLTRRAHLLNATAAAIWDAYRGNDDEQAVSRSLAEQFGAPVEQVAADVRTTLAHFAEVDLLGMPDTVRPAVGRVTTAPAGEPWPAAPDPTGPSLGPFDALGYRFVVATSDLALRNALREGLAALADRSNEGVPPPSHRYDIVADHDRQVVLYDQHLVRVAATAAEALSFVYWHVHRQAVDRAEHLVRLHASAVRSGELVVALPAPPESGKSTLVTALVGEGLGYVTDEALAFEPATGRVVDLPLPITLDRGSWPLFPELITANGGPSSRSIAPGSVHDAALTATHTGGQIRLCIFHRYRSGATTELRDLDPPHALVHLLENAFGLEQAPDPVFDALVALAETATCLELEHGSLADAVQVILDAVREVQTAEGGPAGRR
jgi:rhodanese-related sulfurtransferase